MLLVQHTNFEKDAISFLSILWERQSCRRACLDRSLFLLELCIIPHKLSEWKLATNHLTISSCHMQRCIIVYHYECPMRCWQFLYLGFYPANVSLSFAITMLTNSYYILLHILSGKYLSNHKVLLVGLLWECFVCTWFCERVHGQEILLWSRDCK